MSLRSKFEEKRPHILEAQTSIKDYGDKLARAIQGAGDIDVDHDYGGSAEIEAALNKIFTLAGKNCEYGEELGQHLFEAVKPAVEAGVPAAVEFAFLPETMRKRPLYITPVYARDPRLTQDIFEMVKPLVESGHRAAVNTAGVHFLSLLYFGRPEGMSLMKEIFAALNASEEGQRWYQEHIRSYMNIALAKELGAPPPPEQNF